MTEVLAVLTVYVAYLIGISILGLLAVWLLWQFTIHLFALLQCWGRYVVWYRYRSRCTCEASDPKKWGWDSWKPRWRFRLTDRGKGIF